MTVIKTFIIKQKKVRNKKVDEKVLLILSEKLDFYLFTNNNNK